MMLSVRSLFVMLIVLIGLSAAIPYFRLNNDNDSVDLENDVSLEDQGQWLFFKNNMPNPKAASIQTSQQWSSLEFERTKVGKPFLKNKNAKNFEYNISHHGDLVVMATGETRIGVDVMRISHDNRRSTATEQMEKLKRHFSDEEIKTVNGKENENMRWRAFYRIWCLKESILKATGVGLPDGLHNHTFYVDPDPDPQINHAPALITIYLGIALLIKHASASSLYRNLLCCSTSCSVTHKIARRKMLSKLEQVRVSSNDTAHRNPDFILKC
uniref:L-aminoadipate-semialdehyde dehydrogenase-phosphopantetheinyl transferase n=1 Tax=Caenorhabditis japonica TaxID=281687 RepID=A0A8R1HSG5_CAEJA